jgi:hypothetical protein
MGLIGFHIVNINSVFKDKQEVDARLRSWVLSIQEDIDCPHYYKSMYLEPFLGRILRRSIFNGKRRSIFLEQRL